MSTTAAGRSSTTPAHDPLGHLADDLAQVRSQGLYRPLRVMSSANRTRVTVDGRRRASVRYDAGRYGRRGPATTPGELQPPEAA